MIRKNKDGTYTADYIFRGEMILKPEVLIAALTRFRTLMALDMAYGSCCYYKQLNMLYKSSKKRFFETTDKDFVKFLDISVNEDEDEILGVQITFSIDYIRLRSLTTHQEVIDHFFKWLENDYLTLIPRMIANKYNDTITHMDIITFDLTPKEEVPDECNRDIERIFTIESIGEYDD